MRTHTLQRIEVDVPKGITSEYVIEAIVSVMYGQNKLSLKKAREMLGVTRREFEEKLLYYGISMMGDDAFLDELNNIKKYPA